jgi:hypothetical protein
MNRLSYFFLATSLALTLVFLAADCAEAGGHGHGVNITTHGDRPVTDCSQLDIRYNDMETARAEQQLTIPRAQAPTLTVHAAHNGGVTVVGADRDTYAVKACKAAGGDDRAGAQRLLDRVTVNFSSGTLTPQGPGEDDWVVYLIIEAPRNAGLDLEAHNGPIDVRDLAGTIKLDTVNGPIGIRRCSGQIEARAQNGPIGITAGGGNLHLSTQNGPISVELLGTRWEGAGLEAHAVNGPLTLTLPPNYQSGVRVEAKNYAPFHCGIEACANARKNWNDDIRSVEFGASSPVVRLSTVNGPISIGSTRKRDTL